MFHTTFVSLLMAISRKVLKYVVDQSDKKIYGIFGLKKPLKEVVQVEKCRKVQLVNPIHPNMSIFRMDQEPESTRINKLLSVLKCNRDTLASLDKEWYIPIASVCYWFKSPHFSSLHTHSRRIHLLKALILCFAECFTGQDNTKFYPEQDISVLHVLLQWQCVYNDAIHLNQLLMLPLPYISPALLFDGRRVTYYCQVSENYLDEYWSCTKGF